MRILYTDRLFLRTWRTSDFPLAKSLWGDPDVMTYLGGALSDEKVVARMRGEIACAQEHGVQYWPVFETQTNEFVGCCGMRPWAYTPPAGYEMGFALVKSKWGRGYASEIARGIVDLAFGKLRFPILRAGHHPQNHDSKKILVKLGFQFVDEVFYKPTGLMHPTYQLEKSETEGGERN